MVDKLVKEEEIQPGTIVGYEAVKLEPASTEEYTIWSVEKVYFNTHFRVGNNDHTYGMNLIPPQGTEILVAFFNGDAVELPKGVLSEGRFQREALKLADMASAYENRINDNKDRKSF